MDLHPLHDPVLSRRISVHVFMMFSTSRALLEAFQWSELLLIFLVQAFADIESRALLALIIISLRLGSI